MELEQSFVSDPTLPTITTQKSEMENLEKKQGHITCINNSYLLKTILLSFIAQKFNEKLTETLLLCTERLKKKKHSAQKLILFTVEIKASNSLNNNLKKNNFRWKTKFIY